MQGISGLKNRITIEIKGPEPMRFLNICAFHRIVFYNVEETKDGVLCRIGLSDFKKMYGLRHKAGIHIAVAEKNGVYFWHRRNRKRKAAYLFAAAAFAALYLMSMFIWDISFEGNVRYTDSFLLHFVEEAGYRPGMRISRVSCSELEKKIRNSYDDITWVSAMIDGTRLVIKIKENTDRETEKTQAAASDLYADQSGTVARMITRAGVPQVSVGDEVEQGTLLVSGRVPVLNDAGEADHYLYREASADVWIRYDSWFEYRVSRVQSRRVYDKTTTHSALLVLGKRFALPLPSGGRAPGEQYTEQRQLRLFDNFYLPVCLERVTCREYHEEEVTCSDEELKEQANSHFLNFLNDLEKIGVEIIQNNVTIDMNDGYCLMKGTLVLERNAVYTVPIGEQEPETPENGT